MTTNVLGQNVVEILTYFIHFFLFVHLWIITKLHGNNDYIYIFTTMDISCWLFQINLHGACGISINFQQKYNSTH
jgi:hypothetical protein